MRTRHSFTYRAVRVDPEFLHEPILVGCNDGETRYLCVVWRLTFPDDTWLRVGTKKQARLWIDRYPCSATIPVDVTV